MTPCNSLVFFQTELSVPSMDISDSEEKRKAAAGLIEKYYYQLLVGCGNKNCDNPNCASSGQNTSILSPDDAAARAILCMKARNTLCPLHTERGKAAEEDQEEMEVCSEGGGGGAGCSLTAGPSGLNVQAPPFCPRQTKGNYYSNAGVEEEVRMVS